MTKHETSSLQFFGPQDADPAALEGERVAVLGFGNLGNAFAHNLRDAGVRQLCIGNIEDEYAQQARSDGFAVFSVGDAVACSDIILVLLSDEVIPEVFEQGILSALNQDAAIVFASGYTLAYDLIEPPTSVDVLLLAPRMGGEQARQRFLDKEGFFAYISVEQDVSGKAWQRLLGLAHAVGVLDAGALELDARREADLDLLVEQTIGAAVGVAILSTFSLGVEAGIPPEALVLEMYMSGEMEMVFRAFREQGFFRSSDVHGPTALYGGFLRTMALLQSDLIATFRSTLESIQSGEFARQFQAEREAGYPTLAQAQMMTGEQGPAAQPIAEAEARVRKSLLR